MDFCCKKFAILDHSPSEMDLWLCSLKHNLLVTPLLHILLLTSSHTFAYSVFSITPFQTDITVNAGADFQGIEAEIPGEVAADAVQLVFSDCSGECHKLNSFEIDARKCTGMYIL